MSPRKLQKFLNKENIITVSGTKFFFELQTRGFFMNSHKVNGRIGLTSKIEVCHADVSQLIKKVIKSSTENRHPQSISSSIKTSWCQAKIWYTRNTKAMHTKRESLENSDAFQAETAPTCQEGCTGEDDRSSTKSCSTNPVLQSCWALSPCLAPDCLSYVAFNQQPFFPLLSIYTLILGSFL